MYSLAWIREFNYMVAALISKTETATALKEVPRENHHVSSKESSAFQTKQAAVVAPNVVGEKRKQSTTKNPATLKPIALILKDLPSHTLLDFHTSRHIFNGEIFFITGFTMEVEEYSVVSLTKMYITLKLQLYKCKFSFV